LLIWRGEKRHGLRPDPQVPKINGNEGENIDTLKIHFTIKSVQSKRKGEKSTLARECLRGGKKWVN